MAVPHFIADVTMSWFLPPQISAEVKDLAARARANKLKPEEFMGGTFSISNLGMYGLSSFSAIINPPQAAILAVGGAQQQVVLGPGKQPSSVSYMTVTLSADHRVFDGELATQLLNAFKGYMENPLKMAM
jgi:pyruvate dehydrogenase E2 component (dihydrolipoamide acetyltransferase)